MRKTLVWVEKQFKALGKDEKALSLAEYLIASLQGMSLLTLTFKDPAFLMRQSKNLEQWVETA
jgi:TetR/AcrR family transcriptional repressor of nem operon